MNISADCMSCIINGQLKHILPLGNEATRTQYMRKVFAMIAETPDGYASPWISYRIEKEFEEFW